MYVFEMLIPRRCNGVNALMDEYIHPLQDSRKFVALPLA